MLIVSEWMTMEKSPGIFVFLMKNTNNIELDKRIMEKLGLSKIGYKLNKDYLMTKRENLNRAIRELKGWHLI
jgi:hypothetical protein